MALLEDSEYIPRLIDPIVETHLQASGAIEIAGTMWSGKTWTSLRHANSSIRLDVPENRELAELSPQSVLVGEQPRLIDEWQDVPQIWDVVRHSVDDAGGKKGMYLLTGSSRPARDATSHSGTGRISRLRMWPMSLAESGHSTKQVSLAGLFDGDFEAAEVDTSLEKLASLVVRGGWPGAISADDAIAELVPTQYIDMLVSAQDLKSPGSESEQMLFLQSLARNIGSSVKTSTLAQDAGFAPGAESSMKVFRRVNSFLDYFSDRYVIDAMAGWDAPIRSPQRLRVKPRYNFADPSLPAALLGVDSTALLNNMQLFGQLFEQLCIRDLSVYASTLSKALPNSLRYYRDSDGLEVDVIIELRDGRWGAIEIKLGWNKIAKASESLLRLKRKVAANPAARNPEPSFMMVLIGVGDRAFLTDDGVYVVPVMSLTA